MNLGKIALFAIAAGLVAAPIASNAQQYYDQMPNDQSQYANPAYGQPRYDRYGDQGRRGDYDQRRSYGSYPQFRSIEAHIRSEIQSGLRDDLIAPDDARDLMSQLRQIQYQEAREYRIHGWNLPGDDAQRIQEQLTELDRTVDETRQEP
jgi:hypothetical protein